MNFQAKKRSVFFATQKNREKNTLVALWADGDFLQTKAPCESSGFAMVVQLGQERRIASFCVSDVGVT